MAALQSASISIWIVISILCQRVSLFLGWLYFSISSIPTIWSSDFRISSLSNFRYVISSHFGKGVTERRYWTVERTFNLMLLILSAPCRVACILSSRQLGACSFASSRRLVVEYDRYSRSYRITESHLGWFWFGSVRLLRYSWGTRMFWSYTTKMHSLLGVELFM